MLEGIRFFGLETRKLRIIKKNSGKLQKMCVHEHLLAHHDVELQVAVVIHLAVELVAKMHSHHLSSDY